MFFSAAAAALVLASASYVAADTILVTVGGNTSSNASLVFQPELITAIAGDTVLFNFTQGNHTVIQSDFSTPCNFISDTNSTVNGFNSGFRDTDNGTVFTTLEVPVTSNTTPIWFFDFNTCGEGGVGAINPNQSSTATLAGFIRNAERLNGTSSSSSSSGTKSSTRTASASSSSTTSSSSSSSSSGAERLGAFTTLAAVPLLFATLLL